MSKIELPQVTDDLEQGKRNLDEFGVTIHRNYITEQQRLALLARAEEQARLEREEGVATVGTNHGFMTFLSRLSLVLSMR